MIETIRDPRAFSALREEWNALNARSRSRSFFLTWEWLHTWWTHLRGDRQLALLVARDGATIVGIAPFAIRPPRPARLDPCRTIEFLGTGLAGSDYLDLILAPGYEEPVMAAMAAHLAKQSLRLSLPQVRMNESFADQLGAQMAGCGWRQHAEKTGICPYVPLAGRDWSSYVASLGRSHRTNVRRRLRGLDRLGRVELSVARDEAQRKAALESLVAMETLRRSGRGGSEAFGSPSRLAFHEDVTRATLGQELRLLTLSIDRRPVAHMYAFRHAGAFLFFQSGFDEAYSDHSVGLVMMAHAIRSAIEEGSDEFDMLHGAEGYKWLWTDQSRPLARVDLYPPGLRGHAVRWALSATRRTRRLARGALSLVGSRPYEADEATPVQESSLA